MGGPGPFDLEELALHFCCWLQGGLWGGVHPYKVMGPLPGSVGSLVFARKAWERIKKLVTITPLVAVDFSVHHVLFWGYRIRHLSYVGPRPMGTSRCFFPHRLTST